ncbi:Calvin cycle protein CP12 [Altericista sp. CCNU0014]|uniref:Calvin cycle protein CP12 n=1 Tax=Altericista sp. CCNU0014 TaxID=3082949 RepID=UPI00384CD58F
MSDIQTKIEEARLQAREVCATEGSDSSACAVAYDELEELSAEASHQRAKTDEGHKTSLQQYCDDNPDAAECRLYED